jgi:hypothetical protein
MIEITRLSKVGGPLTKRITLAPDGSLISDGSACLMSSGNARRVTFDSLQEFAACIDSLGSNEAVTLGALTLGLPDAVQIATKGRLESMNGAATPGLISRTGSHIQYRRDLTALALIDIDTKAMPPAVAAQIKAMGGFWPALVSVLPELAAAGRVIRNSTSTGISRADTGQQLPGSSGLHVFVLVRDGADVERFLRGLHARCWLHGFGWMMVGAGGQLLDRSLVDRMVYAPERLVFEGAPVLDPPLAQDRASRRPIVTEGTALDTIAACLPLTIVETAQLKELRAKETHRLAPDAAKARDAFISRQSQHLAERTGMSRASAAQVIARQCAGILLPDVALPFDDAELDGTTVADVLADPTRFEGATLADPLEGIEYGSCKAKIMRRADGTPWIHSFAHGRSTYELRHDARAVEAALGKAEKDQAADTFVAMVLNGDLSEDETETLRNRVAERAGVGKRPLDARLRRARKERAQREAEEERQRLISERRDPRPQITAPAPDAEWLPQMGVLNDVLGASRAPEPPMRDVDGCMTRVRVRPVCTMHTLTARGSNQGDTEETRLPAPDQPLLTRHDDAELAELIEQHVEYADAGGRAVHLGLPFVKHYLRRHDGALPVVAAVATLPMVLPDGTILSGHGLVRERGIVFRVPDELQKLLPTAAECTPSAVAETMRFLADEWFCDVKADYAGKCVLIAAALTIIERLLLPERPAFFITAGQRGGGKTTTANMIAIAILGRRASAAAWSPSDEERRKALLAYLGEGVPFIVWDNIPRGAAISCPSIEKALTAETYSDRVLGVSDTRTVPATAVQVFTGNNIAARGDLASRSLSARLTVDRPDPENREFTHADPIAWTEANRGRILRALFTIALGNPRVRGSKPAAAETRFKAWWHLVGSAVEHAAKLHAKDMAERVAALVDDPPACPPKEISFRTLFLSGEADEEQSSGLATVLDVLRTRWTRGCEAKDVAAYAGAADEGSIAFRAALELASGKALKVITATTVNWRLKALMDAPVQINDRILTLKYTADDHGGKFTVAEKDSK